MDAFVQGFVTGQLVLAIMLIIVARLFFLRDTEDIKKEIRKRRLKNLTPKIPSPLFHRDPEKQEPCSWIGLLLAQLINHARNDPIFLNECLERCNELLNRKKNSLLGEITVTELNLGKEFPNVQNARIIPIEMGLMVEFDFEYNDQLTITIETFALMNWPRLDIAALPVCLSVCMNRFCGKIRMKIYYQKEDSYVTFSLSEDTEMEFHVRSVLGGKNKIKDLPKLSQIIIAKLKTELAKKWIDKEVRRPIPPFWRRKKRDIL